MMLKKSIGIILIYVAAFLFQTNWFGYIPFLGVSINFVLCALVVLNCYSRSPLVFAGAVVAGLLLDLCFGLYVGISAISYFAVCVVLMITAENIDKTHFFSAIYTVLWATVLYETVYWGILLILGEQYSFLYMLLKLPAFLLVNGVVAGIAKGIKG
ncbi:MAG: hypothetical protein EOM59_02245 [Clostridia bacterium]|nr:hypothetical protein [Clostridia bacterium]